jgi:hypothetical protein
LRFTDPSGYVVRGRNDVLNPQYFIWLKSSNSKNGNSFNTDIVEGSPMMMEDNYTVDEQGYIKLVEKTNDDFDMLYTKASWDSGEKDDFIKLDKGIIRNGKEENVSYIKKGDKDEIIRYANVHHYQIIGDNKAKLMFEYLANNTNVEWSQTLVGYSQNEKNIILTSHEYSSEIWCGFMLENGWTIRGHNHSHPRNSKPSKADIRLAESVISKFPDAMLKIYHKHNYYYYDTKETFIFY